MGYCSTAKVYAATLNQLKALDDFDGYKVSYAVYPEASARIVEGLRGVEEGGTLTFGVKNQLGSAIDYVSVNDEIIEADAVVDNENGSQTAWYSVPDIYEEQDVEVYMNDTMAHPAVELEPIVMDDGVIIYISADEGVLPVGVTASAARVSEDVENAVKETAQADAEGKIVSSVMAYDINLWLGDKLLDSDIWGGSKRVRVTFAGAPVEEQNAQSDKVEVMYVETVQDNDKEEKEKVAAQEIDVQAADIVNVEAVGASVDEASVSFEAKHFSIYAIVGTEQYKNSYTMYAGQTIRLEARNALIGGTWTSSDPSVVSVEESGTVWYPYAFVHAKDTSGKTVTLTYSYGWNGRYKQKFEITVKKHEVKAYFYVQRPGMDPDSLENKDWKYVGYGNIDVSGIKNQHGTDMVGGEGHYSLDNPAGRVINYPSDTNIKKIIADLYGVNVNDIDVEISYSPYKITYPMGWVDADNNPHDQGKAVYHVDMTASVTTREKATATYWLWDAGEQGYQPVESHDVSIGDKTSPKKVYDDVKTVDGVEYRFSGWYADAERSQAVGFPYQVDKMVNFYAKYIPNPFITIYYEAVGGGSVSPSTDQFMAYTEGPAGSTGTTPLGYEFKGWFNNDMGLGTPISTNLKFTPSKPAGGWTDGMTFYAVWEGNSDALTYDANKGTGEMSASTGNVGSEVAVKENQFTRQGYYFAGWNTKADGTGTTYMPGENYTLTAGDDILFAVWKEVGTFKVWAYYPDTNPDLSYGDYINIYEDYGPDNAPLTYKKNGTQSGENLTLEGINEILAYSKAETEANHMGAKISSVYLQYETNAGWSKAIYATLKDSKAIAFDGLDDEVFHEGKESRLHITYKLPRTVQVEYWKNIGTGYELVPSEGYGIGPDFVYAYDYISISETSTSSQDIIKAVPASLRGYSTGKVVFKTGTDVPSGEEDDLGKSFRVKDTRAAQRICILLEENEDVTLTYVAGLGGSVNPASETVAPATGIAKGSAAKASPGYHFVNWTVADKVVGTNVSLERQEIDAVAKASGVYKATEFKANFEEDADITINYVAAKGGNVDLSSETLAPATGKPEGSKAVAKDGYVFTHWTDTAGTKVGVDADFIPKKNPETQVFEADTYTAHFAIRGDLSYKVEYYYDGVLGEVDSKDNVAFGTDIPFTTVPRDFNGRNYIFESANGPKTVGSDSNVNLVKVYYVLDEIGVEIPQNPDGIPDKYQITFTFVTGNNGTVSGTTSEVHTIQQITRDPETNEIIKVGSVTPAHPRANVTAAANSGYAFSNWSIDGNAGKTYNNTDAIQADAFVHDTTFIANFRTAGGSGGNGGGGGGSNSGGPGRFSQSDDSGPGAVNIAPQDVPLAPLPETPFDTTLINDDEIPLAPLPKTGQGSVKSTLTMVMSGILLMLTAMSKKRKDEDA